MNVGEAQAELAMQSEISYLEGYAEGLKISDEQLGSIVRAAMLAKTEEIVRSGRRELLRWLLEGEGGNYDPTHLKKKLLEIRQADS